MKHLGNRQVALDSILENTNIYKEAGFISYFKQYTFLYLTKKTTTHTNPPKFLNYKQCNSKNKKNRYIKCLLSNKDTNYKAIQKRDLLSYGISFKHKNGYKIIIDSNNYEQTQAIFFELIKEYDADTKIYMDATKLDPISLSLATKLKMTKLTSYDRMYNKIL